MSTSQSMTQSLKKRTRRISVSGAGIPADWRILLCLFLLLSLIALAGAVYLYLGISSGRLLEPRAQPQETSQTDARMEDIRQKAETLQAR